MKTQLVRRTTGTAAVVVVAVVAMVGAARGADEPYVQQMNVVFGEEHGVGLVMDVFKPKEKPNGLGVVDVTSGAYYSDRGKIEDHRRAKVYDVFCGKGYMVFAVRPGSVTKFTGPEMLANVKRGVRWVKSRRDEYAIDAERLGMMGASAGGHLCCLAAVTADDGKSQAKDPVDRQSSRVKAAAAFFPPTDFLEYGGRKLEFVSGKTPAGPVGRLLFPNGAVGLSADEIRAKVEEISPARRVTSEAPPFLLIHGDADRVVPLEQSQVMLRALKEKGVPSELVVKPGGGHPWLTIHEEVKVMADWFDRQLGAVR